MLGVALAAAGLAALPWLFAGQPGLASVPTDMTRSAVVQGVAIGLLVAVLFSAVPLLDVRRVKPSLLLRDAARAGERDWLRWAAMAALLACLVLIASWQAGSIRIGLAVSVGLAAVAARADARRAPRSSGRSARCRRRARWRCATPSFG